MQGFLNILNTVSFPPPTKEEAKKATQLWIDEIVVKHKLCPYAAKSNYEIIVVTDHEGDSHQARKEIIFQHIDELENCTIPKRTKLLVFPHLETIPTTSLYFEVTGYLRDQVGHIDPASCSSSMTIQLVPFSPPVLFTDEMRPPMVAIQGNSPWNTIQLLKYSDLQDDPGYDKNNNNTLGQEIRMRNLEYIEKQHWTPKDQAQLIVDCYVKAREIET